MIREEQFRISKRPYAVDLGSLRVNTREPENERMSRLHSVNLSAAWFRRRRGVLVATLGSLWDYQHDPKPTTAQEALERHEDGRYGGAWVARWDGTTYVSEHPSSPYLMEEHLAMLQPMLENYPAIPAGYSGWYRFETWTERKGRS